MCWVWVAEKLETQRAVFRKGELKEGWEWSSHILAADCGAHVCGCSGAPGKPRCWWGRDCGHVDILDASWVYMQREQVVEALLAGGTWAGWGFNRTWRSRGWQAWKKALRFGLAGNVSPLPSFLFLSFGVWLCALCLSCHCILEAHNLFDFTGSQLEETPP